MKYGTEPENRVKFEFDEEEFNVFQRLLIKFFTTRLWTNLDIYCVRFFGGSVSTKLVSMSKGLPYQPAVVLKSIGAKSGKIRTCALPYVMDNGRYCVFGSRAGGPIHPAWVFNLRRNPSCWIWLKRKRTPCRAEEAKGEERQRIVDKVKARYSLMEEYERKAHPRVIPVIMLTPLKSKY
ncbi:MAG: nitroreductase/quinone reductase family protein [Halieaceae bacterium]|nr:nitroreductase/quinone reductase family protein [Halieaceae bacterium]